MAVERCNILTCECKCCNCFIPQRWVGAGLNLICVIVSYCMRACTHIAIIRMVKNTTSSRSKSDCKPLNTLSKQEVQWGDNDWDQRIQAWILSAFYIGYIPSQFPAGAAADKFGARWLLSSGILISIVCCFCFPVAVDFIGYIAVIILRVVQGLAQGVIFPAISAYLGRWASNTERATVSALAFSGVAFGSLAAILVSGQIMTATNSWRIVYYFWGTLSLIVYVLLVLYYYSDPAEHPNITRTESTYMKIHTIPTVRNKKTPYRKIIFDGAVIATDVGEAGHMFLLFFFATNVPKYLDQVLKFPVGATSIVTSLPYIGQVFASVVGGALADWAINKKHWDRGCIRKTYTVFSTVIPGLMLLALGYLGCRANGAVIVIVLSLLLMGIYFPGMRTNTLDLTTQYAGFAMGMPNGISAIIGSVVPLFCGYLAPDNTVEQWLVVFWIFSICCCTSAFIFIAMASGKRRRWDYDEEEQKFFVGKVPWFTLKDGIDKDKLAVEAGKAAERAAITEDK